MTHGQPCHCKRNAGKKERDPGILLISVSTVTVGRNGGGKYMNAGEGRFGRLAGVFAGLTRTDEKSALTISLC